MDEDVDPRSQFSALLSVAGKVDLCSSEEEEPSPSPLPATSGCLTRLKRIEQAHQEEDLQVVSAQRDLVALRLFILKQR